MTLSEKEQDIVVIPHTSVIVEGQDTHIVSSKASAPPLALLSATAFAVPDTKPATTTTTKITTTTTTMTTMTNTKPAAASASPTVKPPPGAPEGGSWGTVKYVGESTKMIACIACLCTGFLGCCVLLCPQDEKDAYAKDGKIWDAAGRYIGPASNNAFAPARTQQRMQR